MKINSISLLTLSALLFASSANAGVVADFYVGGVMGVGGITMFDDDNTKNNSIQTFGAVIGMDIPIFRIEGEYDYLNNTDLHTNIATVNAYFKMLSTVITPYFGVGIGTTFDGKYEPDNDTNIHINSGAVYQGMLGLTFAPFVFPVKFDIEGRAMYIPDIFDKNDTNPDLLNYEGRIKLRYIF